MKSSDLMINDWILHNNKPKKVDVIWGKEVSLNDPTQVWGSIYTDKFNEDEIKPIPLTSEILEKNGFKKGKTQYYQDFYEFWSEDLDRCIYLYVYEEYFLLFDNSNADIKYVHELQHAFKLCGIYKEIEI